MIAVLLPWTRDPHCMRCHAFSNAGFLNFSFSAEPTKKADEDDAEAEEEDEEAEAIRQALEAQIAELTAQRAALSGAANKKKRKELSGQTQRRWGHGQA